MLKLSTLQLHTVSDREITQKKSSQEYKHEDCNRTNYCDGGYEHFNPEVRHLTL